MPQPIPAACNMPHGMSQPIPAACSMQHATRNVAVTPCGLLDKCWLVHRRRLACEHLVVLGDVPARAEHAASNTHQRQSAHENAHGCTCRSDCRYQHTHTTLFKLRNVAMSDRSSCSDSATLSVHVWAPQCRQCVPQCGNSIRSAVSTHGFCSGRCSSAQCTSSLVYL